MNIHLGHFVFLVFLIENMKILVDKLGMGHFLLLFPEGHIWHVVLLPMLFYLGVTTLVTSSTLWPTNFKFWHITNILVNVILGETYTKCCI